MTVRRPAPSVVRRPRRIPAARRLSGNPYFNNKKYRGRLTEELGRALLIFGLPALLLATLAYLAWGPTFAIKQVRIEGATADTEKAIRLIVNERLDRPRLLPARNIFFFDKEDAAQEIAKSHYLEGLEMKKRLPGSLEMKVTERTVRAALLADGRFLGLDGTGFLIRELTAAEISSLGPLPPEFGQAVAPELGAETVTVGSDGGSADDRPEAPRSRYPIVTFSSGAAPPAELAPGSQPVAAPIMATILQAFSRLEETAGEPPVRFASRGAEADSLEAIMASGWKAYFSAGQPFQEQADRLALILKEKVGDRRADLEYVDLRYGDRIFFKFKTPSQPQE